MPPGLKNGISFPHVPTLRPLPIPPCETPASCALPRQEAIIRQCHTTPDALAILATKHPQDFGISTASGSAPLFRIPAHALCYLLN